MTDLLIRWAPLPGTPQEGFFDDDTPEANVLFQGGWGSGKTMTLTGKVLKLSAINAPLMGVWAVPDFGHVTRTILPTLTEVDKQGQPWFLRSDQFHYNEKGHTLHWTGGPIQFVSDEEPDKIAGANAAWAAGDEPGSIRERSFRNTVARVRHVMARLRQKVWAGTPEGIGYLLDYFGPERSEDYHLYTMATIQNTELPDDYLRQNMANMTPNEIAAYLEGRAVNISGALAYPMFNAEAQWSYEVPEVNPALPLVLMFDFNVDPMVCPIGQAVAGPFGLEPHIVDMVALYGGSTVDQTCDALLDIYPHWPRGFIVYGDATGRSRHVKSLRSNFDIIKERLLVSGPVTLKVPSVNPPVARRLSSVNRLCKNALGQTRLWIRKTDPPKVCHTRPLVQSLAKTILKAGTDDIEKKPGETHTHGADALGYWLDYEWPAIKRMADAQMFGGMSV